jgi:hypothetical protein
MITPSWRRRPIAPTLKTAPSDSPTSKTKTPDSRRSRDPAGHSVPQARPGLPGLLPSPSVPVRRPNKSSSPSGTQSCLSMWSTPAASSARGRPHAGAANDRWARGRRASSTDKSAQVRSSSPDVLSPRRVVRVQQLVTPVPARPVSEELSVNPEHRRVLVRLADLIRPVLCVNRVRAGGADFR